MLLQIEEWNKIRDQFSEEEKGKLNAAITGEVLCPRACIVDDTQLSEDLAKKLKLAMRNGVTKERLK